MRFKERFGEFRNYWRERARESFVKARIWAETVGFVAFLILGFISLGYPNFAADKTLWWTIAGIFVAVLFFEICFVSPYVHARDLLSTVEALKDRMKSRLTISGGKVEKSFMVSEKTFYFRPMLELKGTEPLFNVEARITQIKKDGEILKLYEQLQLAMHPTAGPTLAVLMPNTLGLVDLIRADSNKRPELALVWPYVTIDRGLVASGHTYHIDIRISYLTAASNALSQDCAAVFCWKDDPSASRFEVVTQPL